jgi:hypothetical protein
VLGRATSHSLASAGAVSASASSANAPRSHPDPPGGGGGEGGQERRVRGRGRVRRSDGFEDAGSGWQRAGSTGLTSVRRLCTGPRCGDGRWDSVGGRERSSSRAASAIIKLLAVGAGSRALPTVTAGLTTRLNSSESGACLARSLPS